MKKAVITGITGQDGAYLSEFLLGKVYQVHGVKRRSINWDISKPDGAPRNLLDVSKINKLGWKPKFSLEEGIADTITHYNNEKLEWA